MDSWVLKQVLSSGAGRDLSLCACACKIWLISVATCTSIRINHKEGVSFVLADALSRFFVNNCSHPLATKLCAEKKLQECKTEYDLQNIEFEG